MAQGSAKVPGGTEGDADDEPRILIADSNITFAQALAGLLESRYRMPAVGLALDDGDGLEAAGARAGVMLVAGDGAPGPVVRAVQRGRAGQPGLAVVVLVTEPTAGTQRLAGQLGAAGWLTRQVGADELATGLRRAARSLTVAPDRAVSREPGGSVAVAAIAPLTERERDVLRLMAKGHDDAEIGARLAISPQTVRTHVQHIRTKLGVRSRSAAVAVALRAGLMAPDRV